jgi:hypothetical protein
MTKEIKILCLNGRLWKKSLKWVVMRLNRLPLISTFLVGIALGVVFGLLFNNLALGIGIGVAIGVGVGGIIASNKK